MTRKDYILIANAVKFSRHGKTPFQQSAIDAVVCALVDGFESDNPNFDAKRFIAACGE